MCFAGKTLVNGEVGGNLMAFTSHLDLRGRVLRGLYAFASVLSLGADSRVGGDAAGFIADADVDGSVGRDLVLFSGSTNFRGNVGRNLRTRTGKLTVLAPAHVGGDLTAYVRKADYVQIDPGATIAGKVDTQIRGPRESRYVRASFYFWQAVRLAAALVTGLVLFWLFPALSTLRPQSGGELLKSVGVGFLILVAVPVGAVLVGITLVGLPIGLMGLAAWLTALYLAKILVAAYVGQQLLARPASAAPSVVALPLLVGLVLVLVAINLPFVGKLVHLLTLLLGLGLVYSQVRRLWTAPPLAA